MPTSAKVYNLRTPWRDQVVISKVSQSKNGDTEEYTVSWLGDQLNLPAGRVTYKPGESRPVYRSYEKDIIPETSRWKLTSKARSTLTNVDIYLRDENTATGEILTIPFRVQIALECPWDYPGMSEDVFKTAFELAMGFALTKLSAGDPQMPGSSDFDDFADQEIDMFSGDMNPKDNNLE
jgi:hypothetical protein